MCRAASVLVSSLISDRLEASEYGDTTWLDVVLEVHPGLDSIGRAGVASLVHGFVVQGAFFTVSDAETRRLREASGDAPLEAALGDVPSATPSAAASHYPLADAGRGGLRDAYYTATETRSM